MVALLDTHCGLYMAQTAEKLAARYGITRQMQDVYALAQPHRGHPRPEGGLFAEEIVPVEVPRGRGKTIRVDRDDHLRTATDLEELATTSCPRSARTARSPPATRAASWTAPPRW